ncbi:IgA peptidase M64-domain-containing protein [Favolaschia claudopus]|uniref:IgA peptidase M64-domain-containing protein n=1 Tax=Favolaschia claudopus TaxID=2862362 RepID=A0AAW0DAG3_9AGAR
MLPLLLFLVSIVLPGSLAHGPGKCVLTDTRDPAHELAPFSEAQAQIPWTSTFKDDFDVPPPPLEILSLVVSGPSSNRVDLIFFADGYVQDEREKFFEDAKRLAEDISGNQTFNTVKPLMNFWAAFTPSKESGVGVGGKPKNTAFGLYRDGTELRGVYYAKPAVAAAACSSLGDQCDYPILLGNDPLYGGLGGRFTVITPSIANGALILRHELGHSIINVGEEYDGGYAYFGSNSYNNLSKAVPWAQWLTDPDPTHVRVERAVMPMQAYAWTLLNTSTPWSVKFDSSGAYARHLVRFSVSGLPEAADLRVELDGEDLGWTPRADIGLDRYHYDVHRDGGLSAGEHTLSFTLLNGAREPEAQMCSAEILEFGDESEFVATPGHYSLYPTFSLDNQTTYRPTNEDCLMRQVTTPNFCKACIEGLWLALLRNVSLIDGIDASCVGSAADEDLTKLTLRLVPLAQFRAAAVAGLSESYTVTWRKDGQVIGKFTNSTEAEVGSGQYTIEVQYATNEVRVDRDDRLKAQVQYTVDGGCTKS